VVKNRPWSNKAYVLQANISCQPCQFTPLMDICKNNKCMDIECELVVTTVTKLYQSFSNQKISDNFFSYTFYDDDKDYTQIWKRTVETSGKAYDLKLRQHSYDIVKKLIPPKSMVFDYACGLGEISKQLFFEKHCDVYGCDANEFAINHVNSQIPGNRFYVGDSIKKGNKRYDFVILSHILEHVKKPVEFIKYIKNYTENIIVVLPNNFIKEKEHKHMAWSNLSEFENLFPDAKKIDNEYPHELPNAFKNPVFLLTHCHKNIHYEYREKSCHRECYAHP